MGQQPKQQENQQNNNFISRLTDFAKTFNGNPEQQVQQLLKSGKISQQDYNNAVQQANAIYQMLNK